MLRMTSLSMRRLPKTLRRCAYASESSSATRAMRCATIEILRAACASVSGLARRERERRDGHEALMAELACGRNCEGQQVRIVVAFETLSRQAGPLEKASEER